MVFQYLDDWLLFSRDSQLFANARLKFMRLLIDLDIIGNIEKWELVPTHRLVHPGIDWNFATCIERLHNKTSQRNATRSHSSSKSERHAY